MLILHVLDHSIPLHSGYTFRSRSIFEHQRRLGWQTDHITSTKHADAVDTQPDEEVVEGLHFYRTAPRSAWLHALPVVNQYAVIRDLERRLTEQERLLNVSRSVSTNLELFRAIPPILSSAADLTDAAKKVCAQVK